MFKVGESYLIPETAESIKIVKDYGRDTPRRDFVGIFKHSLSGWLSVMVVDTGETFPATRDDLRRARAQREDEK